jgi:peptidoglycan/xylan/chitin deacetylase (PgdA/CDA1 family)
VSPHTREPGSDWTTGVGVISIDVELAWGQAHRREATAGHRLARERPVIQRLLELFERFEVPATWAIVGHLFLEGCSKGDGVLAHPEVRRPDYGWLDEDWFDLDPGSDVASAPYHYGPDIVREIQACRMPQEIASHSFSHMIMDDPGCSGDVLGSELEASQAGAEAYGVHLQSLVYPRNAIAHLDRLATAGFTNYRGGRSARAFDGQRAWQRQALGLVDRFRPLRGSAVWPEVLDNGLVNVAQTYLFAPDAKGRWTPPGLLARFPAARVRQAARHRSLCHLWFHPHNLTAEPDRALAALEIVCRTMARERDRGRLDLLTMAQAAKRVTSVAPLQDLSARQSLRN